MFLNVKLKKLLRLKLSTEISQLVNYNVLK